MKKKTRNVVGVLALLVIGVIAFNMGLFSVYDTSKMEISSITAPTSINDEYKITVIVGGGNEKIVGYVTPEKVVNKTKTVTSKQNLEIAIRDMVETQHYSIEKQQVSDIWYYLHRVTYKPNLWTGPISCNPDEQEINVYILGYHNNNVCIKRVDMGIIAPIAPSRTTWKATIDVSVGNEKNTIELRKEEDSKTLLPNGRGTVQWVGDLVTGNFEPSVTNLRAVADKNKNMWHLCASDSYSSYKAELDAYNKWIIQKRNGWHIGDIAEAQQILDTNRNLLRSKAQLLMDESFQLMDSSKTHHVTKQEWKQETGSPYPTLIADLPGVSMSRPMLIFEIEADWIGWEELSGIPEITSINKVDVGTGETGILEIVSPLNSIDL